MTEEVKNKIRQVYDLVTEKQQRIIQVFEDQFTPELVDNSLCTFDHFVNYLNGYTLGSIGIKRWQDSNESGSYTISKEDYDLNGRGKPFLEYIPDLGIIDYLRPALIEHFLRMLAIHNVEFGDCYSELGFFITIKFPEVTVTNEYDKSIIIQDLFVRVPVLMDGRTCDRFSMNRATFPINQWIEGYSHSHLQSINTSHLNRFRTPCTGRGPVNRTIVTLESRYDLDIWGLYAFEIAKYVTVESIAGTPYRRLEYVGRGSTAVTIPTPTTASCPEYNNLPKSSLKDFVRYFISLGKTKISYGEGTFILGESYIDFWIKVSNAFIAWHNERASKGEVSVGLNSLISSRILNKYIVSGGVVYPPDLVNRINDVSRYEGIELFVFKGEMVKLHLLGSTDPVSITHLVDYKICNYILTKILQIVNCNYGRTENEGEVQTCPRIFYL